MSMRELVAAAGNPKPKSVTVEGLTEAIYLRRMSLSELFAYFGEQKQYAADEKKHKEADSLMASAHTLAAAIVNEDGTPVFDIKNPDDVKILTALPPPVAMSIGKMFRDMNKLQADDDPEKND